MKGFLVGIWACAFGFMTAQAGIVSLVPRGAVWKYLDNGSNQGTAWRAAAFNDSLWTFGTAQLGYGDGDEATIVGFGGVTTNKHVTTYFRASFLVPNPALFSSLTLSVLRDDGAVVYLNNVEVFRSNMPGGTPGYLTFASSAVSGAGETTFYQTNVLTSRLVAGTNVIAVEIHQSDRTSSDISFDLELFGSDGVNVMRGPYLQMGTPTSVNVRWRTDIATNSLVWWGNNPTNLASIVESTTRTNEHEIALTNLFPDTKYFYAIGSSAGVLAGGDTNHFFVTSPVPGTVKPTRIWVIGDAGTKDANQAAVRDAYYNFTGARLTDLWLMLGDNAYDNGTDAEYQAAVFNMYSALLRKSVTWPTLGNHDTAGATAYNDSYPYFAMFTLPKNGEAGGIASGTEHYYSFDYANIHFICLDSMTASRSTTGAMANWLRADLNSTTNTWLIAFWHHPPYTKGSHNSDTETQLIEMRTNFLPILEGAGVDLVLAGHSHSYERSFLLNGHYGLSTTLTSAMKLDAGSGRENSSGAYLKYPVGTNANKGAVYAVAGSSGKISGGTLNHPAMFVSMNNLGSMVLDVNGDRLDAKFLRENGVVADYFTLSKAPIQLSSLSVSGGSFQLTVGGIAINRTNIIQVSQDLSTWVSVVTNVATTNVITLTDPSFSTGGNRFYRVIQLP